MNSAQNDLRVDSSVRSDYSHTLTDEKVFIKWESIKEYVPL